MEEEKDLIIGYHFTCTIQLSRKAISIIKHFKVKDDAILYRNIISNKIKNVPSENKGLVTIENHIINVNRLDYISFSIVQNKYPKDKVFDSFILVEPSSNEIILSKEDDE